MSIWRSLVASVPAAARHAAGHTGRHLLRLCLCLCSRLCLRLCSRLCSRLCLRPRRALVLTVALLLVQPVAAQTNPRPAGDAGACAVLWQVTAQLAGPAGEPPRLLLRLRFPAGPRSQTGLHLPGGWAGHTELPAQPGVPPRLRPRPGQPAWLDVAHAPGETVQLQWLVQPAADATEGGHAQLTPRWFAFSGQGVLPMPDGADESGSGPACVALQGQDNGGRWASSHGTAEGPAALFVLGPSPVPLAQRVQQALYAGGALQWQTAPGVVAVLPGDATWALRDEALAQAGARALAAQQRQWPVPAGREAAPTGHEAAPPWLLLALPAAGAAAQSAGLASAWHQALALQLPTAWAGSDLALERLLTQALARAWTAERFGPLAHAGRGDAPLRAWFREGWADFLAHRSLLREGLWTPDDYAAAVNARIAAYLAEPARALPNAQLAALSLQAPQLALLQAMRGEWLALQWHLALRGAGQPGLDAVLRQQLVPAAQARREGPISAPLATHRMVAALRGVLYDQPLRDLQQHIEQGRPFDFGADSLGPCFVPAVPADRTAPPAYRPVADALQQPACQGWLALGPVAETAALPRARAQVPARAASRKAVRQGAAKAAAKPAARPGAKPAARPATRPATRPNTKPALKPAIKPTAKPQTGKPAP